MVSPLDTGTVEQFRSPLHFFQKAFDSVSRECIWNALKQLDYTDEICVLSYWEYFSRVSLRIDTNKTKVVSLTGHSTFSISINGENIKSA